MGHLVSVLCSRLAFRLALTGAAAGMLAGCSSSERLSDPFGNPFQSSERAADPAPTGSISPSTAAPVGAVQSRPLGAPAASAPVLAQPSSHVAAATPSHAPQPAAGWSVEGGSPITLAQGENGEVLARRYGVPLDALVRANGFSSAAQLQPGTRVVIPVYNAALAASSGAHVPAASAAAAPAAQGNARYAEKVKLLKGEVGAHKVASAAHPANAAASNSAKAAPAQAKAPAKVAAAPTPEPAKPATKKLVEAPKPEPVRTQAKVVQTPTKQEAANAKAEPAEAKKPVVEQAQAAPADSGKADSANPEFRWPARGRIIQAFKLGGNDGINIAVPEGTSVKAAESGVVAYAGSELKGYGNLILIRHPNGFVTAYANNSDIEVKRGDTVKRGQTIAKSGQSGNVASPQLHFELRKGATPVDPTQYLAGL